MPWGLRDSLLLSSRVLCMPRGGGEERDGIFLSSRVLGMPWGLRDGILLSCRVLGMPWGLRDGILLSCRVLGMPWGLRDGILLSSRVLGMPRRLRDGLLLSSRVRGMPRGLRDGLLLSSRARGMPRGLRDGLFAQLQGSGHAQRGWDMAFCSAPGFWACPEGLRYRILLSSRVLGIPRGAEIWHFAQLQGSGHATEIIVQGKSIYHEGPNVKHSIVSSLGPTAASCISSTVERRKQGIFTLVICPEIIARFEAAAALGWLLLISCQGGQKY